MGVSEFDEFIVVGLRHLRHVQVPGLTRLLSQTFAPHAAAATGELRESPGHVDTLHALLLRTEAPQPGTKTTHLILSFVCLTGNTSQCDDKDQPRRLRAAPTAVVYTSSHRGDSQLF